MGCDIHCYIEYKRPSDNRCRWRDFGGRINPGRNYNIFSKMAGARGELSDAVVAPRGFPNDAAYKSSDDYWLYISDSGNENTCTKEQAERYIAYGCKYKDTEKRWVSHPDWHTHSWLSADEFERATNDDFDKPEYTAILAAMLSFESCGYESRLVFWFDN